MFAVIFLPSRGTGGKKQTRRRRRRGRDFAVMEMDTLLYHAIILNVNVKYCLLNLRFVCFALSHFTSGKGAGQRREMALPNRNW